VCKTVTTRIASPASRVAAQIASRWVTGAVTWCPLRLPALVVSVRALIYDAPTTTLIITITAVTIEGAA